MTDGAVAPLLDRVLSLRTPAFALLHRPGAGRGDRVDVLSGAVTTVPALADLPLAELPPADPALPTGAPAADEVGAAAHELLVLVPYRQIRERGFAGVDDGTPLQVMRVDEQAEVPLDLLLHRLPDTPAQTGDSRFDIDDARYQELVRQVVDQEIGQGRGANFVLKRTVTVDVTDYSLDHALAFFGRLLRAESGVYWTFVIHTGERTLIGATPERHISVDHGTAVMNPISGTYRYPATGPTLPGVMDFLADRKEADELYMVVDEELKMMARICESGGRVVGPYLKEMARLAHTEYFIEGRTSRDVREILRETLFAPTVTGSPLESASEVIHRYEPEGRGYYSGVAALIGRDTAGGRALDSAILIRTADVDPGGRVRIGVGATLVRHSDPASEVAETRAKAAGLLQALSGTRPSAGFGSHPEVRRALARRNETISGFWLGSGSERLPLGDELTGMRILVVDAEDTFTSMIAHQLGSLGPEVTVRRFDDEYRFEDHDLVVLGPGPGDPRAEDDPKIARLRAAVRKLLAEDRPFLAVCLSHQVLCTELGLELVRRDTPNQGVQREIDLFGRRTRVGFYNTFAARADADRIGPLQVSRDPGTGEVHALRAPRFGSMQFHAESVLTEDGVSILRDAVAALGLRPRLAAPAASGTAPVAAAAH
ncbi:anthranilate synthase family protein [Streptacidiphilus sp. EB129]|uniref:anthranilate synthase family protein n=1 Tax=Streptacidiphilus sp. EB129 TaxID=3156262 RepID=UPI0035150888